MSDQASPKFELKRSLRLFLYVAPVCGLILCSFIPVNNMMVRVGFVLSWMGIWAALSVFICRSVKELKYRVGVVGTPVVLSLLVLFGPGRSYDNEVLRQSYLKELDSYDGVEYSWGGENGFGIDCSGLPRKAMRVALVKMGVRELNMKLVRDGASQWWFDSSAKALQGGYRGYVVDLKLEGELRYFTEEQLSQVAQPGDIAITMNGRHVLVYRGDSRWQQADPGEQKVHTKHGSNDQNPWFYHTVRLFRWRYLN